MPALFLSYRRADSQDVVGRMYDRLKSHFPAERIFRDLDSIPLGTPFPESVREAIGKSKVALVVLGPRWSTITDAVGNRRLDDAADFVRLEVELALASEILIVPVLSAGAQMPLPEELPVSLRPLVYLPAVQVRPDPDFHRDMDRLVGKLSSLITEAVESHAVIPDLELDRLREAALSGPSPSERKNSIARVAHLGGRQQVGWLAALARQSKYKASREEAIRQIGRLGGDEALETLFNLVRDHSDLGTRMEAAEQLIPLAVPDKLGLVVQLLEQMAVGGIPLSSRRTRARLAEPAVRVRYVLVQALAEEGWNNRVMAESPEQRQAILPLRLLAEQERAPDVKQFLVSIVAHLLRDEPWVRRWVLDLANKTANPFYKIRLYAIGLSVWGMGEIFVKALEGCPTDSVGSDGRLFIRWAQEGDWERFRFHMMGWGPTL
jgi:hypothetical protein